MEEQFQIIGICIIILSVWFSGCNQVNETLTPEETRFVGTWQNTTRNITRTIILFSNSSCLFSNLSGIWDVKDDKFVMEFPDSHLIYTFYYIFSDNDRSLSLWSAVTTSTTAVFRKL